MPKNMILIADSGSTKTEWSIINNGLCERSFLTSGINPFFLTEKEITVLLNKELVLPEGYSFSMIYFYGTGCSAEARHKTIRDAFRQYFRSEGISTASDLLGAARSLCQDQPGIACIMGTGSNSCYYDGKTIVSNVAPLGYILGDEGGAAVIGRKLLSSVLKKQVSQYIIDLFYETYRLQPSEILENVYMKPFPNRFLGQFARFVYDHMDIPEISVFATSSFDDFIIRNILHYPESHKFPVNFTGSIAYHFRQWLGESLKSHGLQPGVISLSPMENLIKFHLRDNN